MSDEGIAHVDKIAAEAGVNRSEMIRRMLAFAVAKMPKGWNASDV